MSVLDKAFLDYSKRRTDEELLSELVAIVNHAIGLFELGEMTVYKDSVSFGLSVERFEIVLDGLPNHPFRYQFDTYALMQAYDFRDYMFESMRKPLFEHFRYRPCLPVEDHIILGED